MRLTLFTVRGALAAISAADLDFDMLTGPHNFDRLRSMHLRRRCQNHRVHARLSKPLLQIQRPERYTVSRGHRFRSIGNASDQCYNLNTVDILQSVEMFLSKGAATG